jgi:hypothetical protein
MILTGAPGALCRIWDSGGGDCWRLFARGDAAGGMRVEYKRSFPAEFGNMYVASQSVAELVWTNNSGCHLILESGKFVDAKQPCNEVHKALLHK